VSALKPSQWWPAILQALLDAVIAPRRRDHLSAGPDVAPILLPILLDSRRCIYSRKRYGATNLVRAVKCVNTPLMNVGDLTARICEITAPTFIRGQADQPVPLAAGRARADALPGTREFAAVRGVGTLPA
jgi:hypothetical protein